MKIKKTLLAAALTGGFFSTTSAHAVLTLTLDGQGVYDDHLNITWLQNANLAATNTFGLATDVDLGKINGVSTLGGSYIWSDGRMTWGGAMHWIKAMNANNYLGFNDWRLPTMVDTGTPGCNFAYSGTDCGYNVDTTTGEMAHLWYDELGNKAYYDTSGSPEAGWSFVNNTGPFSNYRPSDYWYSTKCSASSTGCAWYFDPVFGLQAAEPMDSYSRVWAVRPGGAPTVVTSPVPEPETYAMLLAGLGLLSFTARRRKQSA